MGKPLIIEAGAVSAFIFSYLLFAHYPLFTLAFPGIYYGFGLLVSLGYQVYAILQLKSDLTLRAQYRWLACGVRSAVALLILNMAESLQAI